MPLQFTPEENASLLSAIVENAIDGIITINRRGIIQGVNPATCRLFGYEVEEMMGENISMLMPEPHKKSHDGYIGRYEKTRNPRIIGTGREVYGLKKNGELFPFWLAISEVQLADGRTLFTGFVHDLSYQKSVEAELKAQAEALESRVKQRTADLAAANESLQESQLLYHLIADKYPKGAIMVFNKDLACLFAGGQNLSFFISPKTNPQGLQLSEMLQGSKGEAQKAVMYEALERGLKGEESRVELTVEDQFFQLRVSPIHDDASKDACILLNLENVTEMKNASIEMANSLERERELNNLKSRFVSMASHEFRTPLSTIMSSTTLIDRYRDSKYVGKRDKHISRIKGAVRNLTSILNDLLSLGKLEEGRIRFRPHTQDVRSFLADLTEELQDNAKEGQQIVFTFEGKDATFSFDENLLKNVLRNLISNAIKYSEEGQQIHMNANLGPEGLSISVQDEGIGIPEDEQKHLFERFFRAHNVTNIQGTGLGLNIVKEYLKLMDGEINFRSKSGEGSTFFVNIPTTKSVENPILINLPESFRSNS